MNLHSIASSIISAVNPMTIGEFLRSTGFSDGGGGKRVPSFAAPVQCSIQVQALSYQDTMQTSGINMSGERRAMYLNGNFDSVSRPTNQGGDIINLEDGSKWLIVMVLEDWNLKNGWVKVAATRQML